MKTFRCILPFTAVIFIFSFSAQSQCVTNADCNDGIACTVDVCNAPNCTNTPSNTLCDDGIACTNDVCNPPCVHIANNAVCSDSNACNGTETCDILTGQCMPGTPVILLASVTITSSPAIPFCNGAGQAITFTATPTYGGHSSGPSYQWKKNGNNVGSNSRTYANAALVNGDSIWCVMTSSKPCVTNSPVASNVIIVSLPVVATLVTATVTVTPQRSCDSPDGVATVTPTGGDVPYTYLWSNGGTTQTITTLYASTYTVTVADANGCTVGASGVVTRLPSLSATITKTNPDCNGNLGSVTLTPTGGEPPYTVVWSNGSTNWTRTGLSGGAYDASILDARNCTFRPCIFLQPPLIVTANIVWVSRPKCNGDSNGSFNLNVTGGTPPYTYLWSNGATGGGLTNLPAGNYSVTVTDISGCTATTSINLTQPDVFVGTVTTSNAGCAGFNTGSAMLFITGGTLPYSFTWSNGATPGWWGTITNLAPGTYCVTGTDANNCSFTDCGTVSALPPPVITATATPSLIQLGGSSNLNVTGCTGCTYTWSPATGLDNSNIQSPLASPCDTTTYSVIATNANGCTDTANVQLSAELTITATATPSQIQLGQSSSLNVTGCTGCTYTWSPATGLDNSTIPNPMASPWDTTSYSVTATSGAGCSATANVLVIVAPGLLITGMIKTEQGVFIPGALVEIIGTFISSDVTMAYPNGGQYSLSAVPNDDYLTIVSKGNDINVTNGISTLDVLRIRSHILGNLLTSPYKIIAADVNESGTVTTADLQQVRSMVLGAIRTFSTGKLWTFVNSDFVFANPQQPFPYDDFRGYLNLSSNQSNQDFIGIKLGDVNDSWDPNIPKQGAVGDVQFAIDEYAVMPGKEITVPVKVKGFNNVTGYQFSLSWDASVLSLLEVNNKALSGYYGEHRKEEGLLTTTWYDEATTNANTLDDDAVAFELKFKVIGAIGTQSAIKIGSEITASEAYNENLDLLNIVPQNGIVKVRDGSLIVNQQSSINNLSVVPNPFSNSTNIIFSIPQDETVNIVIYDLLGKQVKKITADYKAGEHSLEWVGNDDAGNALSKGLYHVRMVAGEHTLSRKVVMMR